jgi:small basic protein
VNITKVSLYYLGSYLTIIGFALLLAPHATLRILQSNGDYGDVFPRVSGMLMSGLGLSIFGMIRAQSEQQYPTTLIVRTYFLICIAVFFVMTSDPVFLVLAAVVGLGFVMTLGAYLVDRNAL